jgi:putative hemolysin
MSAFLSAAETALTSLPKLKLRLLTDEGVKGSKTLEKIINGRYTLSAILIGNNFVNILLTTIATTMVNRITGGSGLWLIVSTLSVTILILALGEITPKSLGQRYAEQVSLFVAGPIHVLSIVLTPVSIFLGKISRLIIDRMDDGKEAPPSITESELKSMVDVGQEEGVFDEREQELIHNVLSFDLSDAERIMTPRTDLVALPVDASYDEFLRVFRDERFSRVPVYKNDIDHIVGILHIKDFFFAGADFNAADVMREPFFSYESKDAMALFTEMRGLNISLAVILDEYGGTAGIVTLEDLLELLVGDIYDEHDEEEQEIEPLGGNAFLVDGGAKLSDLNEAIGSDFASEDYETVGGYVMGVLGRVPEEGDAVSAEAIDFVVEKAAKNRVERLRVTVTDAKSKEEPKT